MTPDQLFEQASALEGTDPEAALKLYERIGSKADAAGHFLFPMHVNAGIILYHLGRLAESEAHFLRAVKADPKSSIAHYNLACVLEDAARPAEALEEYKTAVEIDPKFADAHYNLALIYLKLYGQTHKAFCHFRAYLKLDPESQWSEHARDVVKKIKETSGIKLVWSNPEPIYTGDRARLALVSDEAL